MNIVVRQFPPSESCSMRVILLSRYGTWDFCKEIKREKGKKGIKNGENGIKKTEQRIKKPWTTF